MTAHEPARNAETRAGHEFWINDAAELLLAVAAALKASPSDSPCNDEPYALVADGYRYWRLRHAYEVICGPLDFDGEMTPEQEAAMDIGYGLQRECPHHLTCDCATAHLDGGAS